MWTVTSAKPGNGVELLRDNSSDTFWQCVGGESERVERAGVEPSSVQLGDASPGGNAAGMAGDMAVGPALWCPQMVLLEVKGEAHLLQSHGAITLVGTTALYHAMRAALPPGAASPDL